MEQETTTVRKVDLYALLDDFLREARRLWALALVLVILCAGALTAYSYMTFTPRYEAYASFTVRVANPLYANVSGYNSQTAEQMASTFPYILTSGILQQRVREHLDMDYIPAPSASVSAGSNIFTLKVTDTDPQRAYEVLNAVIEYYPEVAEFVVGPTVLFMLDESGLPSNPVNSFSAATGIRNGAIIGAGIWAAIVVLLALTKTTVHNEEELRKILNFSCLGQLPATKAARGTTPLIHRTKDHRGFSESVRLMQLRIEKLMREQEMKVLLVSSAIPGEGKTTVAANLAVSLARKGSRVLIVDCDLRNPSVAKTLNLENENGLAEYMAGKLAVRDMIRTTDFKNLYAIVGGRGGQHMAERLGQENVSTLIRAARKLYDFVILDTPPCAMLADAAEAAELAECALLVVRQDYATREQIMEGAQTLAEAKLPILGGVLNGMQTAAGTGYGYGYGYGYGEQEE